MLSEDQKSAVFEICKNFKFYLIPLDGLLRSEEFKRSHQIRIKWIDDEGKSEMPKLAFATLVKGQEDNLNFLNPVVIKEKEEEDTKEFEMPSSNINSGY